MGRIASVSRARFPSTCWSSIFDAAQAYHGKGNDKGVEAVQRFLIRYMPALRKHVLYVFRLKNDQVDDILHDFITDKIFFRNILSVADPQRGKFRTFLLTVLDNYIRNKLKRGNHSNTTRLSTVASDLVAVTSSNSTSEMFDLAWAREVIVQTLHEMKSQCIASKRLDIWAVFEYRVIRPTLMHEPPLSYRQLAEDYGFDSSLQAANALTTAKRMFSRLLRMVVRQYSQDEIECEQEITELWSILAKARGDKTLMMLERS